MTGFEDAFSLLQGFEFANEESRTNALWAALWLHKAADQVRAPFRPPLVAIDGLPSKVCAELAYRLCRSAGINCWARSVDWPPPPDEILMHVLDGTRVVICERVKGVLQASGTDAQQSELARFITAPEQLVRMSRHAGKVALPVRTMIIVVGSLPWLSQDLQRRCHFITLKAGPGPKGTAKLPRKRAAVVAKKAGAKKGAARKTAGTR